MYCSDWGFGYGYYGYWPGLFLSILIVVVIVILVFRLLGYITGSSGVKSFVNQNYVKYRKEKCPNCHAAVEDAYLSCPECNYKLKKNCPSCGKIIKTNWKVCPYCETNLT
ncbi:MAG: zinc ribbon domain-containing protein [Ignavibacteriaceae bacterium]